MDDALVIAIAVCIDRIHEDEERKRHEQQRTEADEDVARAGVDGAPAVGEELAARSDADAALHAGEQIGRVLRVPRE